MPAIHIIWAVVCIDDQENESLYATSQLSVGGKTAQCATGNRHMAQKLYEVAQIDLAQAVKPINPETGRPIKFLELRQFVSGEVH